MIWLLANVPVPDTEYLLPSGFCSGIVTMLPLTVALIGPTTKKLSENELLMITAVTSDDTPAAMLVV